MPPKNAEEFVYQAVLMGELEIDSQGRIWRIAARGGNRWKGGTTTYHCEKRRAENDAGQYLQVRVMIEGKRVYACAHRLVWRHFNGPIPKGMTINHKNGKKKENHPNNLELATYSGQAKHRHEVLGYPIHRNSLGQFSAP